MEVSEDKIALPEGVSIDATMCPACGNRDAFQEVGKKESWQRVELTKNEGGHLEFGEWGIYETGDETDESHIQCLDCLTQWQSLAELEWHMAMTRLLEWMRDELREVRDALARDTDHDLLRRIGHHAINEGARLDPRALDRPDPEPFVRETVYGMLSALRAVMGDES